MIVYYKGGTAQRAPSDCALENQFDKWRDSFEAENILQIRQCIAGSSADDIRSLYFCSCCYG